jgi:hypothetical protein
MLLLYFGILRIVRMIYIFKKWGNFTIFTHQNSRSYKAGHLEGLICQVKK